MANHCKAQQNFINLQADVLRLADRDHGLSIKRLAMLTEIPATTLVTWKNGTAMPAWAMVELARFIPDDLMSLMTEPAGKFVGTLTDDGGGCLDSLGREAAGYTAELLDAKSDGIVTPMERAKLGERARRVASVARAVAA